MQRAAKLSFSTEARALNIAGMQARKAPTYTGIQNVRDVKDQHMRRYQ